MGEETGVSGKLHILLFARHVFYSYSGLLWLKISTRDAVATRRIY